MLCQLLLCHLIYLSCSGLVGASLNQCCDSNQRFNTKITDAWKSIGKGGDVCVQDEETSSNDAFEFDTESEDSTEIGFPNCTNPYVLNNRNHLQFRVTDEGQVQFLVVYQFYKSIWLTIPQDKYCLGSGSSNPIWKLENSSSIGPKYNANGSDLYDVLVFCNFDDYETFQFSSAMYGVSRFISALNLLMVLTVYLINYKSHKVVGWLTCCYIFSLTCHCTWMGGLFLAPLDWFQPKEDLPLCQFSVQVTRYFSVVLLFTAMEFNFFMFLTFWRMNYKLQPPGRDFGIVWKFFAAAWLVPGVIFGLDVVVGYYFGETQPWIYRSYSDTNHYTIQPYTIVLHYAIVACTFGCILLIIASGIIIMYLRTSSKVAKVSYSESVTLFLRLICGSGLFLFFYALADYKSRETQNSKNWKYWSPIYCVIAVANSFYVLIVFGLTGNNFSFFVKKVKSTLRMSRQFPSINKS